MEPGNIPTKVSALERELLFERSLRLKAETECRAIRAELDAANAKLAKKDEAIAHYVLEIEKLRRQIFARRSEASRHLFDQLEFSFLSSFIANNNNASAGQNPSKDQNKKPPKPGNNPSRKNVRQPWPENAEVIKNTVPAPRECPCCGGNRLRHLDPVVTRTLEVIPRRWVVQEWHYEKVTCRDCEKMTQAPALNHPTPRGLLGPVLLAMILADKYHYHTPLNRQSKRFAREGVTLSVQTLADQVGHCVATLMPLFELMVAYTLSAERLHADDTTIRILAKGRCQTGRIWVYVRDDQPFGGQDPPAAIYYATRDRRGEHPMRHLAEYEGIVQMDCYSGFVALWDPKRKEKVITPAFCWAHARRLFFELADIQKRAYEKSKKNGNPKPISPLALEAVARIDALLRIERGINGKSAEERRKERQETSKPLLEDLHAWMIEQSKMLSSSSEVLKAMNYMLHRWEGFARYLDDGRICMTNNAAERGVRGVAVGRKNWLFAGSGRGADRAAVIITLLNTAELNGVDPQRWLADVLDRISDWPNKRLHELLPWEWKELREAATPAGEPVAA